ncbi:MFS transporter [Lewinella sp. 4G2]|uniref:MFS transporter n=1 Tax=Lewinella sp. 4G2 TaxID=1803372 RepID=UPI0007B4D844|nr:MFS transporter [Lewinella sp. 4G2]OAV43342.1 hypothetical protein A3850_002005 [Lewinella sp. 4G2]
MSKAPKQKLGWPVILFITATFVSNVGTWLFAIASSWLMTELDGSALMVSLVQSATTIPLFIFALPAGALGDLYDRRKSLLIAQVFLTISTAAFATIVYLDLATVTWLLVFTFFNGVGAAFARPIMSAIIPQLVEKAQLRLAVNLGGMSFNLSRSVGPALGGHLITRFNIALPYWVDAATFLAVLVYIFFWRDDRKAVQEKKHPPLSLAIGDSWRFFRHTPALNHSIVKAATFFFAAGALWALLPLVAKDQLAGQADLYGYLVGAAGGGAVISSFAMGWLTKRFGANGVMLGTSMTMALGLCLLGWSTSVPLSLGFAALCGASWQAAYTSLMTSTQYSLPRWFGARGMAYYIMSVSLCLAIGSALWGWLADLYGLPVGHYAAAGTLVAMAVAGYFLRLDQAKEIDLELADRSLLIKGAEDLNSNTGRSQIVRTYTPNSENREELLSRLNSLSDSRFRAGALELEISNEEDDSVEERITSILDASHGTVRFQTTQYDADREEAFREWLRENEVGVESKVCSL